MKTTAVHNCTSDYGTRALVADGSVWLRHQSACALLHRLVHNKMPSSLSLEFISSIIPFPSPRPSSFSTPTFQKIKAHWSPYCPTDDDAYQGQVISQRRWHLYCTNQRAGKTKTLYGIKLRITKESRRLFLLNRQIGGQSSKEETDDLERAYIKAI